MKHRNLILAALVFLIACHSATQNREHAPHSNTRACWIDFRIGELPPVHYYDARDSIVRKWKLCYKRIEGGCEATVEERHRYEKRNEKYFKLLAAKYGQDWLQRFNKEVRDLEKK